ncbi:MAG TPA: transglutaminase-like domain-containing protein [Urbifossiella sp.]|nr:transglutaminase-like domain-containing protein [Urbifossiella sp.]
MRPAVLALLLCAAPAAADDFAPKLGDTHFGYYAKGRRVGTLTDSLSLRGAGADAHYLYTFEMHARYHRDSIPGPTQTTFRAEFDARPPFALRLATYCEFGRAAARSVTVERTAAGYDTVVSQSGEAHRFPSAVTGFTLRDLCRDEPWLRRNPPAGDTLAATDLVWAEARTEPVTHRSLGRVGGAVEYETLGARGRVAVTRFDPEARRVVRIVFPDGAEYRAEPPDPARALDEPELPASSLVPADRPLGRGPHPWLRVTLRGYSGTGLRSGPGQTVEPRADGVWTCRLGKGEGAAQPATDDDARAALAETPRFPHRHPKVVELARRAVGSARTPAEKVERLVRFVHAHVRYELTETPELFELLGTRRGNCQSFALLFVALARAEGLPAREVDGLAYASDDPPGFGPHRWAEVARDAAWHPVDATTGVAEVDATYIRLDDWADGMTLTVDEVAWPRGVRWVAERPWVWVVFGLVAAAVAYRGRRPIRAGTHPEAPAEPGGDTSAGSSARS